MGDIADIANARIYIGGTHSTKNADFVAGDFSGDSFVEIDGWDTEGSYGDMATKVVATLINRGRDTKLKGTVDGGSMANTFALVQGDAGQAALRAAGAGSNKNNYAFKIVYDDQLTGGGTGTTQYFIALVMGFQDSGGGANTVRTIKATLEINSNVVTVAAT
jgi:hypothetical protein